jgi:hypothetical protein
MIKLVDILKEINEAKQAGILYHFTPFKGILGILKTNTLKVGDDSNFESGGNVGNISLTRDKNIEYFRYRITLDGNKLSNNYKIKQYAFPDVGRSEAEEYINKDVKNIKNYILDIHFLVTSFQEGEMNKSDFINLNKIIEIYPNIKFIYNKKKVDYEFIENFINFKEKNSAKEIHSSEFSKTYKYKGKYLTIIQRKAKYHGYEYTISVDGKEYDLESYLFPLDKYVKDFNIEYIFDEILLKS